MTIASPQPDDGFVAGNSAGVPASPPRNIKAIVSLILGIATLTLIPILSLLVAPCGFPTALLVAISAITLGRQARREPGAQLASTAITTAWIGIILNTLIMLLKLSMFVVMFILPVFLITHTAKPK